METADPVSTRYPRLDEESLRIPRWPGGPWTDMAAATVQATRFPTAGPTGSYRHPGSRRPCCHRSCGPCRASGCHRRCCCQQHQTACASACLGPCPAWYQCLSCPCRPPTPPRPGCPRPPLADQSCGRTRADSPVLPGLLVPGSVSPGPLYPACRWVSGAESGP